MNHSIWSNILRINQLVQLCCGSQSTTRGGEDDVKAKDPIKTSDTKSGSIWTELFRHFICKLYTMAVDHKKFQFPSLTTDEAVANCKSMFGSQVALTADDFVRPQVSLCQNFSYVIDSMNSKISLSNNFFRFFLFCLDLWRR